MSVVGPLAYLVAALAMIAAGVRARRDGIASGTVRSRLWFAAATLFVVAAGLALATHLSRS